MTNLLGEERISWLKANKDKIKSRDLRQIMVLLDHNDNFDLRQPIATYDPQDYQLAFHNATPKSRIKATFSANQTGKTYAASKETAIHFTGKYPDWWQGFRVKGKPIIRVLVKDFPKAVREVIQPAIERDIPDRYIESKITSKKILNSLRGKNGARLDIVTHDMDVKSLEGWQGNVLWCDEPPPRDYWIACQRGLMRQQGFSYLSCTPLDEPWIYDDIYLNKDCFTITVDIRQNKFLSEENIKIFESQLTEDEKEARLHGRFMHLSGLVYKEFNPAIHCYKEHADMKDWTHYQVIDPHNRRPFAIIYFAVDPQDNIWIYKEWPQDYFHNMKTSNLSPRDYVNLFHELEEDTKIYRRIMDGRFCKQPQGSGGDSLLDIFADMNIHFIPSYITTTLSIADPGHLKVKHALRVSPISGKPILRIHESCRNVVYAFQHNTWSESRNQTVLKEKPSEFAKDFLDCIRYGLMDDPIYTQAHDIIDYGRSKWQREEANVGSYGSLNDW